MKYIVKDCTITQAEEVYKFVTKQMNKIFILQKYVVVNESRVRFKTQLSVDDVFICNGDLVEIYTYEEWKEKIGTIKVIPFSMADDLMGKVVILKSCKSKYMIIRQSNTVIGTSARDYTYKQLLEFFEFPNGGNCGKYSEV